MNPDKAHADSRFHSRGNFPPGNAATRKCSYCGESFAETGSGFLPFCSRRCQQLDLRNWLTESYGLPWEGESDEQWDESEEFDEDPGNDE